MFRYVQLIFLTAALVSVGCGGGDNSSDAGRDGTTLDGQTSKDAGPADARLEDGHVVLPDATVPETRSNDELLELLPDLQCEQYRQCFGGHNCRGIQTLKAYLDDGDVAVAAGEATINRDNLVRCIRTLETGVCAPSWNTLSLANMGSACQGIFDPSLALEAACSNDLGCPNGSSCIGAQGGCTGTCRTHLQTGAKCGEGVPCIGMCQFDSEKTDYFCIDSRQERQRCESDNDCAPGLDCSDENNGSYCTPRATNGSKCLGDIDCPGGQCVQVENLPPAFQCRISDHVAKPGERCGPFRFQISDSSCQEGHFCGRAEGESVQDWGRNCLPVAKLGEVCRSGENFAADDCEESGYCSETEGEEEKKCVADKPVGESCQRSAECVGESLCNPLDNKCAVRPEPVGAGQDCNIWQLCLDSLACANGKCTARAASNEACDPAVGCAAEDELCHNQTRVCTKYPTLGQKCDPFFLPCAGSGVFCGESEVCVGPAEKVGDPCQTLSQCPGRLVCFNGECAEPKAEGETCALNEHCAEELLCSTSPNLQEGKCARQLPEGSSCTMLDWCTGVCSQQTMQCTCDLS